jgi:hypothetical protein
MNISDINLKNARLILQWCYDTLGESDCRSYSKLKVSISKTSKYRGLYEESESGDEGVIYINPEKHRSFNEFIDTMIHEYTHFLQGLKYYDQILEITGYDKHPMEQSSNLLAEILKKKCRKDLFSN